MELSKFIVNELLNDINFDVVERLLSEEGMYDIENDQASNPITIKDIAIHWMGTGNTDWRKIAEKVKTQLILGIRAEMEYTNNVRLAAEIAKKHLMDDPSYYDFSTKADNSATQDPHPEIPNENTIKEENPNYDNDSDDLHNIYNTQISDPSTGRKFKIKDALRLDPMDFAHQEAMRMLRVLLAQKHRQTPGNIGKGQQSPETDKPKQVNLSLYAAGYGEGVVKEASSTGSGYDEKVLDQLVDNPETGEKVKVRSALNYDRNHPAYRAAIALVRKANAIQQGKGKVDVGNTPPQTPQNNAPKQPSKQQPPNASEPISVSKRFGNGTQDGSNTQNGTHSTNKTQKPLEKPLSAPNDVDNPVDKKDISHHTVLQPTKGAENGNKAGVGKVASKAVQNPKIIARAIHHNIKKWSREEKEFFVNELHKANSETRRSIGQAINHKIKAIVPAVKKEMSHLGHEFKHAGEGISHLFQGKKLSDKEKHAFKSLAKTVAMSTMGVALGPGLGHGAAALVSHLGTHLAQHMVGELAVGGIGKAALFAGYEQEEDTDKYVEWFILAFAKRMKDGEIPLEVWENAVQDYTNDKEDGKFDKKDDVEPEETNEEVIAEESTSADAMNGTGAWAGLQPGETPWSGVGMDTAPSSFIGTHTLSDISSQSDSANSTTGTEHNATWDEYDHQGYYTDKLPGWQVIGHLSNTLPDEVKNRVLPIFNHAGNENGPAAHTIQKIVAPNLIKYESFERTDKDLLMEGGAAGHLAHPFEDENLTFSDMKFMIGKGLLGGLDSEGPVSEKLDGQNIAFSVRDGKVVFGRNKGHVKDSGKNALDTKGIYNQFKGRGGIEKAFVGASEDLQSAVKKLSPAQIKKMFGNGSKFMSLEIILPDTTNVIPYGKSVLVMHGTIEYNKDGEQIRRSTEDAETFAKAVQKVGADKQKTFGIEGPRTIAFSDEPTKEYLSKYKLYHRQLSDLEKQYGLTDKSKLEDYRRKWWSIELDKQEKQLGIKFTPEQKKGLIKRWADGDKTFGVKNFDKPKQQQWFRDFDANKLQGAQKQMIKPVESVFLNAGAQTLKRVTNFLASNNPGAADELRKETIKSIKGIKDSKDVDKIAKLQTELERLHNIGMDNVVPSEGIVFQYKGKPYKFTGAFAPINQINGSFKFDKPKKGDVKKDDSVAEIPKVSKKEVAIFTGRFQPFHAGHYSIYKALVDKFGKDNVYIASSNVQDPIRSPFPFKDKKQIMHTMFDIPTNKIVQVKNPYAPNEILDKLPKDTPYVTAVSQKDAERLEQGGKYFKNYDKVAADKRKGYEDEGYYIVAPEMQLKVNGKNISGTQLRATFGDPKMSLADKKKIFTQVYPKFDKDIFARIVVTTKNAEKAKGGESKPKPTEPQKSKVNTDIKNNKKVEKVLQQKIKNPETGRMILVKTALGYDKSVKVRKNAMQLVKNAMSK